LADCISGSIDIDETQESAVLIEKATFEWEDFGEVLGKLIKPVAKKNLGLRPLLGWLLRWLIKAVVVTKNFVSRKGEDEGDAVEEKSEKTTATNNLGKKLTFQIRDVSLEIPRGALWAITGPVGCGKSSLLQGFIGGTLFRSFYDGVC
jgi:ABC-type glutathione transport system ATPase component